MTFTYVELFAGAGGLSRGLDNAGMRPIAHCEIEPNARAVLRHQWPDVRLDGDVTQVNGADFRGVTLVSGGSPCQDLSVAGKRAGLGGARSGLFYEQVRIWEESDAPYLLWENVLGALSSNKGQDFAAVLSAIVGATIHVPENGWRRAGVAAGSTAVAAWRVLDLQHFGPPQRRVRVFIVAARAGGVDPAEVLALSEGVCGHPSPREQSRQRSAGGIGTGAPSRSSLAWDEHANAGDEMMGTLQARAKSGQGRAGVLQPMTFDNRPTIQEEGVVQCLTTQGIGNPVSVVLPLAFDGYNQKASDNVHHQLRTGIDSGDCVIQPVFTKQQFGRYTEASDVASTIGARDHAAQHVDISIANHLPRRLTPTECERLMSWPDGWTATGVKEDGTVYQLSDTARYRLCGNGVGSVCVEWIAKRLVAMEPSC